MTRAIVKVCSLMNVFWGRSTRDGRNPGRSVRLPLGGDVSAYL
jgi:hypothetical protein